MSRAPLRKKFYERLLADLLQAKSYLLQERLLGYFATRIVYKFESKVTQEWVLPTRIVPKFER
jgi:hypothetical protein